MLLVMNGFCVGAGLYADELASEVSVRYEQRKAGNERHMEPFVSDYFAVCSWHGTLRSSARRRAQGRRIAGLEMDRDESVAVDAAAT